MNRKFVFTGTFAVAALLAVFYYQQQQTTWIQTLTLDRQERIQTLLQDNKIILPNFKSLIKNLPHEAFEISREMPAHVFSNEIDILKEETLEELPSDKQVYWNIILHKLEHISAEQAINNIFKIFEFNGANIYSYLWMLTEEKLKDTPQFYESCLKKIENGSAYLAKNCISSIEKLPENKINPLIAKAQGNQLLPLKTRLQLQNCKTIEAQDFIRMLDSFKNPAELILWRQQNIQILPPKLRELTKTKVLSYFSEDAGLDGNQEYKKMLKKSYEDATANEPKYTHCN